MLDKDLESIISSKTDERIKKTKSVLSKRQHDLRVVMENVHDPHNISASLRSCDATGVYEVDLIYHSGQVMPKLGKQSSASAKKWVKSNYYQDVDTCFKNLKKNGYKIYTTHLSLESVSIYDIDFTEKCAIVFGNEHSGISDDVLKYSDKNFVIPQVGMIQSLNISVSVAVTLYEAYRQRYNKGFYSNTKLEESEFNNLLKDWLQK